ncbi:MAG: preprotein translocase subunit YajC [Ignavibacteriae bacterium]|nr:preprotein translocase subunit YajC [Ignavibacteriota bacterium]
MAPSGDGGGGSMISTLVMFSLIIFIFYFMIIRPQQKRAKERQQLLDGVKKGDKIVTVGGLHGTVIGVEEKTLLIQVADDVKLKFEKTAVQTIDRPSEEKVGKTS